MGANGMKTKYSLGVSAVTAVVLTVTCACSPSDWPQWRGPNRDGISKETGLLKEWPKTGPKLLWQAKDIGQGYSTPSVVGDRLYLMSNNKGLEDESVKALNVKDGKEVWSVRVGKVGNPDQKPPYPAARSTPTIEGDVLYALGSDGDLVCMEIASGKIRWQKSLRGDFGGKPGMWAYSESPLIDGDALICTPGGGEATMVALNKKNGEVIWKCALPEGDLAAYSSAIVLDSGGTRQYVQLLQKGLVGVEAKSGKMLWRFAKPVSRFDANIPTPVAGDNYVYVASAGTGAGAVKLTAKGGSIEPEQVYFEAKLPTAIGGAVKVGDYLYGTTAQAMLCIEFTTGTMKWQDRALGAASLCFADGCLYLHGENGEVALVEPSAESYREKGRFTPPDQPAHTFPGEKAWAYPVVANGRLYVRDHGALWCYDVKAGAGK
jgi:outer membrane protein assembly factor BamB